MGASAVHDPVPLRCKRSYEPPSADDGKRYLIDRLWPRGITKDALRLTEWLKVLAPSPGLCDWFGHDPARFRLFRSRYRKELGHHGELLERLELEARHGTVTLVCSARDVDHCNGTVLRELLQERLDARSETAGAA
jgi:uncharacterized protein YeaO (DUF488 family)